MDRLPPLQMLDLAARARPCARIDQNRRQYFLFANTVGIDESASGSSGLGLVQ